MIDDNTWTTRCGVNDSLDRVWNSVKSSAHPHKVDYLEHMDTKRTYSPDTTLNSIDEIVLVFRLTFAKS